MKSFIKKHKRAICISIILLALLSPGIIWWYNSYAYMVNTISSEKLEEIKKTKAKKLMIVAHPDDETLWGGIHLIEDDYYVVCVTNGNNSTRSEEFKEILEATGNEGIILSYPDKVHGERDDWTRVRDKIETDINNIIAVKDWNLIVTHNPDGEYGHAHHIMTDEIVTGICEKEAITDRLWYFGKYYKKAVLGDVEADLKRCSDEELEKKEQVLALYKSQGSTVEKLGHMNPYENWVSYSEWN